MDCTCAYLNGKHIEYAADCPTHGHHHGLSRRDEFAKAAMQGLIAGSFAEQAGKTWRQLCAAAIGISDEMLRQLDSSPSK